MSWSSRPSPITVRRTRSATIRWSWPGRIGTATRPRFPASARRSATRSTELSRTGRLAFYDRLAAEVPAGLIGLLKVQGVGPKTVKILHEELGIADLDGLRAAAEGGRLRTVKGLSEKAEASILAGIAALDTRPDRLLLGEAEAIIERLLADLSQVPGVTRLEPAGSYRRRRETIGDLDLLAETADGTALIERFSTLAGVERVLGAGGHKAAIILAGGPQVDLMLMPPGEAGTYLIHFTGSKDHNIRLRGIARDRGWSLSEKGFLRIAEDGSPVEPAELRTFPTEAEAYAFLDLPFIEPELREDRGEIEAAQAGRLPALIELADLRGDLHSHSDWSDGVHSIEQMAEAARERGHAYQVLTDHTRSLAIAKGLTPERVADPARRGRRAERPLRPRRGRGPGARPRPRPRAFACSTAASSRSAPTRPSTSTTTCWPSTTWSSPRSTSAGASPASS